jgi:hypothetical protein
VALESKAQKTIYQYAPNGVITHAKTSDTKGSLSVKYYYTFYE